MKECGFCGELHDKKGKFCSDSCKMKDYRRRNATVTFGSDCVTVGALRFEDLPFDVRVQISSVSRDAEDFELRVGRALRYQLLFPESNNTSTLCSCRVCREKNSELALRPEFGE